MHVSTKPSPNTKINRNNLNSNGRLIHKSNAILDKRLVNTHKIK